MINQQNFTKKTKRTKRLPDYSAYFNSYEGAFESLRTRFKKIPKRAFYRWSSKRFSNFKKTHECRRNRFNNTEKHFSLKRDGIFLTLLKLKFNFVLYIILPICLILVMYLWLGFSMKFNVRYVFYLWNKKFPDYYYSYIQFCVLNLYYLGPLVFTLKFFLYSSIFIGHIFVIMYIHFNTKWNDFMERKLISICVWRLGIGFLPGLPIMLNVLFFWGEEFTIDFYKNVFIVGPSFIGFEIWQIYKQIKAAVFPLISSIFFNIFK